MQPENRPPTHPGQMLEEEFLRPLGLTQAELAKRMGVDIQSVSHLVNGKSCITADMARGLARVFKDSPQFWTNLQKNYDLWSTAPEMETKRR